MSRTPHASSEYEKTLSVEGKTYHYFSLKEVEKRFPEVASLPYSLKILLENAMRYRSTQKEGEGDVEALARRNGSSLKEIAFYPGRVLMQDFTGVPAIVDLAAMRHAIAHLGGDPRQINPLVPVDLVIDHSVMVDSYGSPDAFPYNVRKEYERNRERYAFLRWGQEAFDNFRVVPPGTGICHQVNLEYLGQVVWTQEKENGKLYAYPDTVVGTDSHTPMINGLSVLGWGVGGIEAEAAMLGQPLSMVIPEVIGVKLQGTLREGVTATDLVLTLTQMLRAHGVVGKFIEFYGEGLDSMAVANRATLSNMSPEFGATCSFFPVDAATLKYLAFTGREPWRIRLVEAYAKEQGLWRDQHTLAPSFTQTLSLNLGEVEPTLAGPKRPQDKISLSKAASSLKSFLEEEKISASQKVPVMVKGKGSFELEHGHVVIAAITSCTNTSNPAVMLGAGLLARNARDRGLKVKPWVKTSLAPGSQVVTDYLQKAGLQEALNDMGFHLVGYGCTTCIGNSGPLLPEIAEAIEDHNLGVASVLSGNRNFEGRIHPQVKYSYLASPLLVVAYALAGSMKVDLTTMPLGVDDTGREVYLKDIWPSHSLIQQAVEAHLTPEMFRHRYGEVFKGDENWRRLIQDHSGLTYAWDSESSYVKLPPYFQDMPLQPQKLETITQARPLAILGDSITTDHISPAGSIKYESPAGQYLTEHHIERDAFNSYGSRRGNHEIMMRGTFANIRLQNEMTPGVTGGMTKHFPSGAVLSIYDAAMAYQKEGVPLVIIAGREYGSGSSRDWAAKGVRLLGVKAVIAESFERIHRSNLMGMGVLPLEFMEGMTRHTLKLTGEELFDLSGFEGPLTPGIKGQGVIHRPNGSQQIISLRARIDTSEEAEYFRQGGILPYVLRNVMASQNPSG